jgi:hypothetical protein
MADFHQASPSFVTHAAAGAQCTSISLVAMLAATQVSPEVWTKEDIHSILHEGDRLHLRMLYNYGWPSNNRDAMLDIDELPENLTIYFRGTDLNASVGVIDGSLYCIRNDLLHTLNEAFRSNSRVIIRINDTCIGLFKEKNHVFVFDSHARNDVGEQSPTGSAGLFKFSDVTHVAKYLCMSVSNEQDQIDIHPVNIRILTSFQERSEVSVHQHGNPIMIYTSDSDCNVHDSQCSNVTTVKQKGITIKEILKLSRSNPDAENVHKVMPRAKSNTIFMVDMNHVNHLDLTCDNSGIYTSHSTPSTAVTIDNNGKISVLARQNVNDIEDLETNANIYVVKRTYSSMRYNNQVVGKRIVSKIYCQSKIQRFAVIQYLGSTVMHKPHGNSKKSEQYVRTKPSVMERIKSKIQSKPKEIIKDVEMEVGGPMSLISEGDAIRDRRQVYNIKSKAPQKHKSQNSGHVSTDFNKLVAEMTCGGFIKDVSFESTKFGTQPKTFAATSRTLGWIKQFCTPEAKFKSQLQIDMTYKVGPYYTTCCSFKHPLFVYHNSPNKHPTVLACIATSTTRCTEDYAYLANQIKKHTGVQALIYGTDGELALEKGLEREFPIDRSIKLRCFSHVQNDMEKELKRLGLDCKHIREIISVILGYEQDGTRTAGLVDVSTRALFESKYKECQRNWPDEFTNYLENKAMRVRSLKETLLLHMGQDVRIRAGLGNPPSKYTNNCAEAMNNVLKQSNDGLLVDLVQLHDRASTHVFKIQEDEMVKAIYRCGEYRLATDFSSFQIKIQDWVSKTAQQKQKYCEKLLGYDVEFNSEYAEITRKLSIEHEETACMKLGLNGNTIKSIWHTAELLLSHEEIKCLGDKNCISHGNNVFVVDTKGKGDCSCSQFSKLRICPHIIAISDVCGILPQFLKKFQFNPMRVLNAKRPSKQGDNPNKKRRRGCNNMQSHPIEVLVAASSAVDLSKQRPFSYNEIHHNDEPFIPVFNKKLNTKTKLVCQSCQCDINIKNCISPHNFVISKKERWLRPDTDSDGNKIRVPTHYKMTTRYYCVKSSCILKRHPYFWGRLLKIDQPLNVEQLSLLENNLGYRQ